MIKKEKKLFSQTLIKREKDLNSQREYKELSNKLTMLMLEMTKDIEIARNILFFETAKIESRGIDSDYLFDTELTFEDIISYFYDNSILSDDSDRIINSELVLSELLLIYGVFNSILNSHVSTSEFINRQIPHLNIDPSPLSPIKRSQFSIELSKEKSFIQYLKEIEDILLLEIANSLGFDTKESLFNKSFDLNAAVNSTTKSFKLVSEEIKRRNNSVDESVDEDFILLYSCGDTSKSFFESTDRTFMAKQKIFSGKKN